MADTGRAARVTGVTPAHLYAVSYEDEAGNAAGCPMMIVDGKAYRFADSALEADPQTPAWLAQGLLDHVKSLEEGSGDEEV